MKATLATWIPLSAEQELFWLYYQLTGDSLNIIFKIELPATINPEQVSDSFNAVIAAHDVFWYQAAKYQTLQRLGPVCPIMIIQGNFILKTRAELDAVMEVMHIPFSLTEGPKVRAQLMRNPNASYTLYVAAPHQVIDYITMGLIIKSFRQHLNGEPTPFVPGATYADYITESHTAAGLQQRRENHHYWQETLKTAEPLRLQRQYIPTGISDLRTIHLVFEPGRYARLLSLARQLGIPEPIFFYACIYTAMYLLTASPNFVFEFMFALKRSGQFAGTAGPMIGLLPIKHTFTADDSVQETVRKIYQEVKTAHKHKRFTPNIDLMSSLPPLLQRVPLKYRLFTRGYVLLRCLLGRHTISAENMDGMIAKTKRFGLDDFAKQATEPYTLIFNPRLSRDMRGETYSSWIEDDTLTMGISCDNEATDHRPGGIYFTLNYDTRDQIELHSTPFINPAGREKFIALLETIFENLAGHDELFLKDLVAKP